MDFTIGFLSPYKKLAEEGIKIAKEKHISLVTKTVGFENALVCANDMVRSGIIAIVLRAATDSFLKEKINIPLVPIPINSSDILKAIVEAKKISNHIIYANFKNYFKDIDILQNATGCTIDQFIFNDMSEADKKIEQLGKDYKVLIGGGYTTSVAKRHGMKAFLIETTRESLEYAFNVACKIAESKLQEQQKSQQISTIINQSTDGIISVDKYKKISVFNVKAEKIYGLTLANLRAINKEHIMKTTRLSEIIKTGEPIYEDLVNINNKTYIVNSVPTIINEKISGGVCTLQEVSHVQKIEQKVRITLHDKSLSAKASFDHILGESEHIKKIISKAKKFARVDFPILISGETGTGKELFVQSIHNYSARSSGPFVAVNCAAIPDNLLEAVLFGYEEGSFTGAKKGGKSGLFELAHNGTLFFDEIADMPLTTQVRLLRVIQEKEVFKIGGNKVIPVNVRIIAATNCNLSDKVHEGTFREDLYYRISVLHLNICPLRERMDDIPIIVRHFLNKHNIGKRDIRFILSALLTLHNYEWKGNVRELENVLANIVVILENNNMGHSDILDDIKLMCSKNKSTLINPTELQDNYHIKKISSETEYQAISQMMEQNLPYYQLARKLGISRTTLWRKLKKFKETSISG